MSEGWQPLWAQCGWLTHGNVSATQRTGFHGHVQSSVSLAQGHHCLELVQFQDRVVAYGRLFGEGLHIFSFSLMLYFIVSFFFSPFSLKTRSGGGWMTQFMEPTATDPAH